MTGIIAPGFGSQGVGGGGNVPSSGASRLKALEKKLAQLKDEKEEAVKNKNKDKARELEQEIQKVEQQIRQLKKKEDREKEREKEKGEEAPGYGQRPVDPETGNLIDVYG